MPENLYMHNMQQLLHLVKILHDRVYEKIRVVPSLSPSGLSWRCLLFCGDSQDHIIGSNWIYSYFGNKEDIVLKAEELVRDFEEDNFKFLYECRGGDERYTEWYRNMLVQLEPEELPYAFSDYYYDRNFWNTNLEKKIAVFKG